MNKGDGGGMGLAMAGVMAICCAGPLLLAAVAAPALAMLTGQAVLIGVSLIVAVGVVGVLVWRHRSRSCTPEFGAISVRTVAPQSRVEEELVTENQP